MQSLFAGSSWAGSGGAAGPGMWIGFKLLLGLGVSMGAGMLVLIALLGQLWVQVAHTTPVGGMGGAAGSSTLAQAALSLEHHLYGPRTNLYDVQDPFMVPVEGYWKSYCANADGSLCGLAAPGGLQCVQFASAAYWLAGDPLPSIHNAIDFWSAYATLAGWQRIPSPSSAAVAFVPPAPGDLVIWQGGSFGHIAVVVDYQPPHETQNGSVEVAQANASGNRFADPMQRGNTYRMPIHPDGVIETWPDFAVLGFLRHLTARVSVSPGQGQTLPAGLTFATPYVQEAWMWAQRAGIAPGIFVRQINVESHFDPTARSPAGAEGIAQFMPETAAGLSNPLGAGPLDPWNPHQALAAAAQYLATQVQRSRGDYALALASYNAGDGAVQAAEAAAKNAGHPTAWRDFLPTETQQYLHAILDEESRERTQHSMFTSVLSSISVTLSAFQPASGAFRLIGPLAALNSALVEKPVGDETGISDALIALARIGVGILAGFLTAFLVVQGYQYMTTEESVRGPHLRRGLSALLGGAILVTVAVTLAPQLVNAIVTGDAGSGGSANF